MTADGRHYGHSGDGGHRPPLQQMHEIIHELLNQVSFDPEGEESSVGQIKSELYRYACEPRQVVAGFPTELDGRLVSAHCDGLSPPVRGNHLDAEFSAPRV